VSSRARELLQLLAVVNSRLSEDVSLPALAQWAHRSRFDLHRRLRRLTGQTPKAYTTRVRLARAAGDLVAGERRVSVIAFDHGFRSHEVFTRTFTRHLGRSPQSYRALADSLPKVFDYAQRHGLAITGPPFARYPEVGMGSLVIEGGITVAEPPSTVLADGIEALVIPAGRAVVTIHRGPYDSLSESHQHIGRWMREQGLSAAGPPRETYLTDPGERPDPATWETEIVQPVR
jgi:AraC-like DNA-binding protein